jgi:hypothetical protein
LDVKNIEIPASSFYNLEIDAAGAEYQILNDLIVENNLSITNGTFNLNSNDLFVGGSLTNSGTFTIGNQKITFNGDAGTHTINSGGTSFYEVEINSNTGNATYNLVENLDVANNFTLREGNFSLSPDAGTSNYNLTIGKRFTNIKGDFSAFDGNMEVNENWISGGAASFNPGTGTVTFISNSGTRTISPKSNSFYDVVFNGTATFRLSGDLDVDNNLNIANGTLDVGIAPSYDVFVGGDWINNSDFIERASTVIFDGDNQQLTATGDETFYNMNVENNSLILNNNLNIANDFVLDSGYIDVQANTITLGTDASNIGSLSYTSGVIDGKFQRWMNAVETDYIFPLGTSSSSNVLTMRFITNITAGSVIAEFMPSNPGTSGVPLNDNGISIDSVFTDGSWSISAQNSLASTDYNVTLDGSGFSSYLVMESTRLIKRTNGGDWEVDGNHVAGSGDNVFRQGMSGIATTATEFGLGKIACMGGQIGTAQTICSGNAPVTHTNESLPTGGASYSYTWQYTEELTAVPGDANWIDISSSDLEELDYGILIDDTKFIRKENGVGCSLKYSNIIN